MKKSAERKQRMMQYLRTNYTQAQLYEKGKRLADCTRQVNELEEEAKRVASDYKARISRIDNEVSLLCTAINTGYAMGDVDCEVTFNSPKNGKKTIVRMDTGETVGVEDMTVGELQDELPMEGESRIIAMPVHNED